MELSHVDVNSPSLFSPRWREDKTASEIQRSDSMLPEPFLSVTLLTQPSASVFNSPPWGHVTLTLPPTYLSRPHAAPLRLLKATRWKPEGSTACSRRRAGDLTAASSSCFQRAKRHFGHQSRASPAEPGSRAQGLQPGTVDKLLCGRRDKKQPAGLLNL